MAKIVFNIIIYNNGGTGLGLELGLTVMVYWKKAFAASKMPKETIAPMKVLKGSGRKPKPLPLKKKRKLLAKDSTDAQGHANKKSFKNSV